MAIPADQTLRNHLQHMQDHYDEEAPPPSPYKDNVATGPAHQSSAGGPYQHGRGIIAAGSSPSSSSTTRGGPRYLEQPDGIELIDPTSAPNTNKDRRKYITHADVDGEEENILKQSLVPLCGGLLFIFIVLFIVNTLSKNGIFGRHNKHFFSKYLAEEVGIISENGYMQHTLEWVEDEIENDLDKWRDILHMENGGMDSGAAVAADEDLRAAGGTSASSPASVGHRDNGAIIPYKSTSEESPKHLSDHPHPKETNLMKLPITWEDEMPSDLDFRRKMRSRVFVQLDTRKSNAKMLLPPRNLNVHGYRGISIGKYGATSATTSEQGKSSVLYFTLEMINQGNQPWEISDHIMLRELADSYFHHEILHDEEELLKKHPDGLPPGGEINDDTSTPFYDDTRGMKKIPHDLLMHHRVGDYDLHDGKTAVQEKLYEDNDVDHDDDVFYSHNLHHDYLHDKQAREHHGVFGRDLSFTHGEVDKLDTHLHDHKLHLTHDFAVPHVHNDDTGEGGKNAAPFVTLLSEGVVSTKYQNHKETNVKETPIPENDGAPGVKKNAAISTATPANGIGIPIKLHPNQSVKWHLRVNFNAANASAIAHKKYAFSVVEWMFDAEHQFCDDDDADHSMCSGQKKPVLRNFGPVIIIEMENKEEHAHGAGQQSENR